MVGGRRRTLVAIFGCVTLLLLWRNWTSLDDSSRWAGTHIPSPQSPGQAMSSGGPDEASEDVVDDTFLWRHVKTNHPVHSLRPLPSGPTAWIPRVQASPSRETTKERETRLARLDVIRRAIARSWEAYKKHAWLHDEVGPVSGSAKDPNGGWAATLVDALDTLWIAGLHDEFELAVDALDKKVSFEDVKADAKRDSDADADADADSDADGDADADTDSTSTQINVSEATVRLLGGLLAAHDLSGDLRLLRKARDVGDMLYKAFDTPNRMPVVRWDVRAAAKGADQAASSGALLAEVGSLGMEFTRLSLLTGDSKYYDAVQRVADVLAKSQDKTRLPGLWPVRVDASAALDSPDMASGTDFSLGDGAAAAYESLAKMVALLGGKDAAFAKMYSRSADAALQHLAYRPMVPEGEDILFVGEAVAENANDNNDKAKATLRTSADHASCSVGGMLALGGRLVGNPAHVEAGRKLTQGCAWAYEQTLSGVMPASLDLTPCPGESASSIRQSATADACAWNKTIWEHAITARQRLTAGGAAASSLSRFNATIFARKQNLPQGFAAIPDPSHALGPQAIESIFILSRIMGGGSSGRASRSSKSEGESSNGSDNQDDTWMDMAWSMWQSIDDLTRTDLAYGGARTVNPRSGEEDDARAEPRNDVMPSVWMGATLKYYFLVFSEPEFLSLDKWVFSTGGHPFRRMG